jgi:hypothetical protein
LTPSSATCWLRLAIPELLPRGGISHEAPCGTAGLGVVVWHRLLRSALRRAFSSRAEMFAVFPVPFQAGFGVFPTALTVWQNPSKEARCHFLSDSRVAHAIRNETTWRSSSSQSRTVRSAAFEDVTMIDGSGQGGRSSSVTVFECLGCPLLPASGGLRNSGLFLTHLTAPRPGDFPGLGRVAQRTADLEIAVGRGKFATNCQSFSFSFSRLA